MRWRAFEESLLIVERPDFIDAIRLIEPAALGARIVLDLAPIRRDRKDTGEYGPGIITATSLEDFAISPMIAV
jgi:hypothetical protein